MPGRKSSWGYSAQSSAMSIGENDHKTMRNDDEMAPKKHPGRPAGKKKQRMGVRENGLRQNPIQWIGREN